MVPSPSREQRATGASGVPTLRRGRQALRVGGQDEREGDYYELHSLRAGPWKGEAARPGWLFGRGLPICLWGLQRNGNPDWVTVPRNLPPTPSNCLSSVYCSPALRTTRSCRSPGMAGVKATRNLRTPGVPGKVQGLRFLPAGGKRLGSPSARENQRLPGGQKSVQPFFGLPEASQVLRSESTEFQEPAVSGRREGNPTLINLLANEAH